VADNDKVNGEALTGHGRGQAEAGGSDDRRRSGDREPTAEAGASAPSSYSAFGSAERTGDAALAGKVWLEVAEFKGRPEGGYAVVRLHGLRTLPADATFTILPGEQRRDHGVELLGWPEGEHLPVARRETAEGIELVIGPDVVESAALLPGTPVVVEIAAAGVRGEILWPSIAPRRAPPAPILPVSRRFSHVHGTDDPASGLSGLPRRTEPEVIELSALPPLPPVPAQAAADFSNLAALAASLAAQGRKPLSTAQSANSLGHERSDICGRDEGLASTKPDAKADAMPSPSRIDGTPPASTSSPGPSLPTAAPGLDQGLSAPSSPPDGDASDASAPRNRSDIVVSPVRTPLKPVESTGLSPVDRPSAPAPAVDRVGRGLAGIALFAALLAAGSSLMVLHTLRGMMPTTATASTVPPAGSVVAQSPKGGVTSADGTRAAATSATAALEAPSAKAAGDPVPESTAGATKAAMAPA
jgi:hypothetical protein